MPYLRVKSRGYDPEDRLPLCFFSSKAVHLFRLPVPTHDCAVQILADYGLVRGLHYGGKESPVTLGCHAFGNVPY